MVTNLLIKTTLAAHIRQQKSIFDELKKNSSITPSSGEWGVQKNSNNVRVKDDSFIFPVCNLFCPNLIKFEIIGVLLALPPKIEIQITKKENGIFSMDDYKKFATRTVLLLSNFFMLKCQRI